MAATVRPMRRLRPVADPDSVTLHGAAETANGWWRCLCGAQGPAAVGAEGVAWAQHAAEHLGRAS